MIAMEQPNDVDSNHQHREPRSQPHDDDAPAAPPPRLPVDREWLQKLLQKHAGNNNSNNSNSKRISAYALAPMVDQSDRAFRMQCRRHGANLCFTPMIHARLFCTSPAYRQKFALRPDENGNSNNSNSQDRDRPLIAQLCGSDLHFVLEAARQLAPHCDAIDVNCGCPQGIARRGQYGAFLLEQPDLLLRLVRHLARHLTVPLTVKVRLLPPDGAEETDGAAAENFQSSTDEKKDDSEGDDHQTTQWKRRQQKQQRDSSVRRSLQLYAQLVDAGAHMLTVHGRTRLQKGADTGPADWEAIRAVVDALGDRVPVLANGSVATQRQVRACLRATQCDGVVSSEAILEYPPLFRGLAERDRDDPAAANNSNSNNGNAAVAVEPPEPPRVGRLQLALEYLDLATQYPPDRNGQGSGLKCIRAHVHRFLHADLQNPDCRDLRQLLVRATSVDELRRACLLLQERHSAAGHDPALEELSWYVRHRTLARDAYGVTVNLATAADNESAPLTAEEQEAQDQEEAACFTSLFGTAGEDEEEDW